MLHEHKLAAPVKVEKSIYSFSKSGWLGAAAVQRYIDIAFPSFMTLICGEMLRIRNSFDPVPGLQVTFTP